MLARQKDAAIEEKGLQKAQTNTIVRIFQRKTKKFVGPSNQSCVAIHFQSLFSL